jgi:hypothetical protein
MNDELPRCKLCGFAPHHYLSGYSECDTTGCDIRGIVMADDDWRRLHGQRLAPEHVAALRGVEPYLAEGYDGGCITTAYRDAIERYRAALAALGEG